MQGEAGRKMKSETRDAMLALMQAKNAMDSAPKIGQDMLLARNDDRSFTFGRGVTRAEAEWMRDLIRFVLSR